MNMRSKNTNPRAMLKGARPEHIDLLQHAGINYYEQLIDMDPVELLKLLESAKADQNFSVKVRVPALGTIKTWINQASSGQLPGGIITKPIP